jgi:hypothetical protein
VIFGFGDVSSRIIAFPFPLSLVFFVSVPFCVNGDKMI